MSYCKKHKRRLMHEFGETCPDCDDERVSRTPESDGSVWVVYGMNHGIWFSMPVFKDYFQTQKDAQREARRLTERANRKIYYVKKVKQNAKNQRTERS